MYATRDSRVAYIEISSSTDVFLWILEQNSRSCGQVSPPFPVDRHNYRLPLEVRIFLHTQKLLIYRRL